MPDQDLLTPGPSDALFTIVPVIIGIAFVLIIGSMIYRGVRLASRGVNPLTLQEDLATQAMRSEALAPQRSKSARLDELDLLHSTGRISDAEHAAARARVLGE